MTKNMKMDKLKLTEDAMGVNHTRLVSLKRWSLSML